MSAVGAENLGVVSVGLRDGDKVEHNDDFDEDVEELGIGGGRGEEIDFCFLSILGCQTNFLVSKIKKIVSKNIK